MKNVINYYIIIVNILITIEQKNTNNFNKNESGNTNNDNNTNNHKSKNIKSFILYICFIVIFILLVYIIVKICVKCFKKKYAYKKLLEDFINNKLIKEDLIDQVKYVYGFNYVISFLKEIIFISCKYKQKYNELKNCGNCSICLNGFELNDKIFITACNHVYHNKCMVDYLDLITKEIDPNEKEIQNFHNYFKCPNCKEFLYINRNYVEKKDISEINCENQNNVKNVEIIISSHKTRQNPKNINIINTESSSVRNLKKFYKNKKNKKPLFKKGINNKNENINNNVENKNELINSNNTSNIQSNMQLKENLEIQKMSKIKTPNTFAIIENDKISTKNEEANKDK